MRRTPFYQVIPLVLPLFLLSCSDEKSQKRRGADRSVVVLEDGTRKYTDSIGDFEGDLSSYEPNFVDLAEMTIKVDEHTIEVSFTVVELPAQLLYNHENLEENTHEYRWEVRFDVDGDSKTSVSDLAIAIFHAKEEGGEKRGALTDFARCALLEYTSVGEHGSSADHLELSEDAVTSVSGDTITITVNVSANKKLKKINAETEAHFSSSHTNGRDNVYDEYPEKGGFR